MYLFRYFLTSVFRDGDGGGSGGTPPAGAPPAGAGTPPAGGGAPPAEFTPAPAPWTNDKVWTLGDTGRPWHEAIPEADVRERMKAKGYANPAILAMSYHNLEKLHSGAEDVIAIPKEGAPPEEFDAFYKRLGRPESADKYDLKMPDGVTADENMVKFGRELAFKLGLPPKAAQTMADAWNEFAGKMAGQQTAQQIADAARQNDVEIEALKTKLGDKFPEAKAAGERAVKALGLDAATLDKVERNIGAGALVDLLCRIGLQTGEGGFKGGGGGNPNDPSNMTPQAAQARINQLNADPDFQKAYFDKAHPQHAEKVNEMLSLNARLVAR